MKFKTYIWILVLFIMTVSILAVADPPVPLTNIRVCDSGTEAVADKVTLCYGEDGTDRLTLDSVQSLNRNNQKPYYSPEHHLAILYYEPPAGQPKTVKFLLTRDVSGGNVFDHSLGYFAVNRLTGYIFMLVLDNEFYVPGYNGDGSLFNTRFMNLTHIPTGQVFRGQNYNGSNWYLFDVLGGKQIAMGAFGNRFLINSLQPGETPAAYVIPWNLSEQYEIRFNKNSPVNITDPALGVLTVCQDDNLRDPEQVQVCRNNVFEFTLQRAVMTKRTIAGTEMALLFDVVNGVKQVSLFSLHQIHRTADRQTLPLFYNNFIDNMVAGKRIAFEFPDTNGDLYLLSHPLAPLISLPSLALTAYSSGATTSTTASFAASGSPAQVEFSVSNGGKIFIKRNYGNPPPPFDIWALEQQELAPVDLNQTLFTSFSSLSNLIFNEPNIGTVSVRTDDTSRSSLTFKLQSTSGGNVDLNLRVPHEVGATGGPNTSLFYYHTASVSQGLPIKTASMYKFYELTPGGVEASHFYNDTFIEAITTGHELALQFGTENYYILSHENPAQERVFFEISRLRLRPINSTQSLTPLIDGPAQISFNVPEGKIVVRADDFTNKIYFKAESLLNLVTEDFAGNMKELTTTNQMRFSDGLDSDNNPTILRLCFLNAYNSYPSARVCSDETAPPRAIDVVVDQNNILTNNIVVIEGQRYLLESNQQMGNNKKVFIRKLITLFPLQDPLYLISDWSAFVGDIIANKKPVFEIVERLYSPYAQDGRLHTFGLGVYPLGAAQLPQHLQQNTPISYNGSIVVGDRLVFISQRETGIETNPVSATLNVSNYYYLPDNHDVIRFNTTTNNLRSVTFVVAVGGTEYTLNTGQLSIQFVRLSLAANQDSTNPLLNRLFAVGDTRVLNLGTVQVEIKVESIFNQEAQISIKRR